jgi:signal transduction histidine kinase
VGRKRQFVDTTRFSLSCRVGVGHYPSGGNVISSSLGEAGLAERPAKDQFEYLVATSPPTLWQRQLALAIVVVSVTAFGAVAPFANTPLPRIDSFIPTVLAIAFVTDLVTAVLLFGQSSVTGSSALVVLANGYLFSSLIVIPHALTFPGAFAPTGLLGAGPQSTAWLNVFWRFGLAVALVAYACLMDRKYTEDAIKPSARPAIYWSVPIVISLVCTLTWAVTAGDRFMPSLFLDGTHISPLGNYVTGIIALTSMLALLLLWTRGTSVLDLWLMVAVCALLAETVMVAFFLTARFSLAFYFNRVVSLLVSKVVLIVLLSETMMLQARLSIANRNLQRERENRLMSAEAVVAAVAHEVRQPLTGITLRAAAGKRFLNRAPPDIAEVTTLLDQIKDAAFHGSEVFESFLSLFRGGAQELQPVDMNALAREAVQSLRKELDDHNIVAHTMLTPELPAIQGNRGQLREVILNLVQNSIEAMATTTKQRVISVVSARHDSDSISISLQDTGPGIAPNKLASIFDPFVTTKAKGTGFGLAICKMIIERHGGKLSAASDTYYGGARFEITLPTKIAEPSVPGTATEQRPRRE